jgi:hypothetical protein
VQLGGFSSSISGTRTTLVYTGALAAFVLDRPFSLWKRHALAPLVPALALVVVPITGVVQRVFHVRCKADEDLPRSAAPPGCTATLRAAAEQADRLK